MREPVSWPLLLWQVGCVQAEGAQAECGVWPGCVTVRIGSKRAGRKERFGQWLWRRAITYVLHRARALDEISLGLQFPLDPFDRCAARSVCKNVAKKRRAFQPSGISPSAGHRKRNHLSALIEMAQRCLDLGHLHKQVGFHRAGQF